MRKLAPIIPLLALAAFLWALPSLTSDRQVVRAFNQENLVRFHVVANSDADADQAVKLRVRDAIIQATAPALRNLVRKDEVMAYLKANSQHIREIASRELAVSGHPYPVEVEVGRFAFAPRTFQRWGLPGGDYDAVRVVIGEGRGRNWWCILFPPVCFTEPDGDLPVDEPMERSQVQPLGDPSAPPVEVRFALADLAQGLRQRVVRVLNHLALAD